MVGFEPPADPHNSPKKTQNSKGGGARDGARAELAAQCDPKRRDIIAALPDLPEPIINAILNLITLARPKG